MSATLIGSERQVTWATSLRDKAIAGLQQACADAEEDDEAELVSLYTSAIVAAESVTSAAVWIELRTWPVRTLASALAGRFPKVTESYFSAAHQLAQETGREAQFWTANQ